MPEGHNFKKIEGRMKKGDVTILHSHTVHGSEPNTSQRMRRSLLFNYVQKGINFREGEHMKRERYDLKEWFKKYWS
jgi:ectoine hydroxylase-related dioxygenase (phytanoyl-CoA dioxygenase family)